MIEGSLMKQQKLGYLQIAVERLTWTLNPFFLPMISEASK